MHKHWVDYLRALAIVGVVAIHVSVTYFARYPQISGADWWMANVLNATSRFAVPIFVMIAGAVLLGRPFTASRFYRRRALRLIPAMVAWNLLYFAVTVARGADPYWEAVLALINLHTATHLWFLPMYLSLVAFAPMLNKLVRAEPLSRDEWYWLGLWLFVWFGLAWGARLLAVTRGHQVTWFSDFIPYVGYFLAGYYLDRFADQWANRKRILVAAMLVAVIAGLTLNYIGASRFGLYKDYLFMAEIGPLELAFTLSLFLLVRVCASERPPSRAIASISRHSFGIYLLHPLVLMGAQSLLPGYLARGVIYMPLVLLGVVLVSWLIVGAMSRSPLVARIV